jgi:hypothetical protein
MAYRLLLAFSILKSCAAATCYEGQGKAPNIQLAWDLRQQICGSENACSRSDAARGNNHYCTLYRFFNRGVSFIQFERNDPSGQHKTGTQVKKKKLLASKQSKSKRCYKLGRIQKHPATMSR